MRTASGAERVTPPCTREPRQRSGCRGGARARCHSLFLLYLYPLVGGVRGSAGFLVREFLASGRLNRVRRGWGCTWLDHAARVRASTQNSGKGGFCGEEEAKCWGVAIAQWARGASGAWWGVAAVRAW